MARSFAQTEDVVPHLAECRNYTGKDVGFGTPAGRVADERDRVARLKLAPRDSFQQVTASLPARVVTLAVWKLSK